MTNAFTIEIASVPDRDDLVAEVWRGDEQIAEIRREGDVFRLQIFASGSARSWDFEIDSFIAAIAEAKDRLGA